MTTNTLPPEVTAHIDTIEANFRALFKPPQELDDAHFSAYVQTVLTVVALLSGDFIGYSYDESKVAKITSAFDKAFYDGIAYGLTQDKTEDAEKEAA